MNTAQPTKDHEHSPEELAQAKECVIAQLAWRGATTKYCPNIETWEQFQAVFNEHCGGKASELAEALKSLETTEARLHKLEAVWDSCVTFSILNRRKLAEKEAAGVNHGVFVMLTHLHTLRGNILLLKYPELRARIEGPKQ